MPRRILKGDEVVKIYDEKEVDEIVQGKVTETLQKEIGDTIRAVQVQAAEINTLKQAAAEKDKIIKEKDAIISNIKKHDGKKKRR